MRSFAFDIETLGLNRPEMSIGASSLTWSKDYKDIAGFALAADNNKSVLFYEKAKQLKFKTLKSLGGKGTVDVSMNVADKAGAALSGLLGLQATAGGAHVGKITEAQHKYLLGTSFGYDKFARQQAAEGLRGGLLAPHQAGLVEASVAGLESLPAGSNVYGYNSTRFDIPYLMNAADRHGYGGRLRKAVSKVNMIDLQEVFRAKLAQGYASLPPDIAKDARFAKLMAFTNSQGKAYGYSLDIAAATAATGKREIYKMLKQRARSGHASMLDAAMTLSSAEHIEKIDGLDIVHSHLRGIVASMQIKRKAGNKLTHKETELMDTSVEMLKRLKGKIKRPTNTVGGGVKAANNAKAATTVMSSLFGKAKSLKGKHIAMGVAIAGAVAAAPGILSTGQRLMEVISEPRLKRNEWISASTLQLKGDDMISRVSNPALSDVLDRPTYDENQKRRKVQDEGTGTHRMIQMMMEESGLGKSEAYVEDTRNRVFGYVDFMLNSGIPLEIKTADDKSFQKLTRPKEEHISQANFDAIASGAGAAYIMYAPRRDPHQRKLFKVEADYSRYANDIKRARKYQARYGDMPSPAPFLENARPLASWGGQGVNRNIQDVSMIGMNDLSSRIMDQKSRLSNLPIGQTYGGLAGSRHANERGRMESIS